MSTWTKDKPTPGKWWVSLAPEKRNPRLGVQWEAVLLCLIVDAGDLLFVQFGRARFRLALDIFVGAQWKRVDPDPADPFADKRPSSSCDASKGSTNV